MSSQRTSTCASSARVRRVPAPRSLSSTSSSKRAAEWVCPSPVTRSPPDPRATQDQRSRSRQARPYKDTFTPGVEFRARSSSSPKVHTAPSPRNSSTNPTAQIHRCTESLQEVWRVDPSQYGPGEVVHTLGWVLDYNRNLLFRRRRRGRVVGLDISGGWHILAFVLFLVYRLA